MSDPLPPDPFLPPPDGDSSALLAAVLDALNGVRLDLADARTEWRENTAALGRRIRWRFAIVALVILMIPTGYSAQRHSDCHATNTTRASIRIGIVETIRGFGADAQPFAERAARNLSTILPDKDCGGVFP